MQTSPTRNLAHTRSLNPCPPGVPMHLVALSISDASESSRSSQSPESSHESEPARVRNQHCRITISAQVATFTQGWECGRCAHKEKGTTGKRAEVIKQFDSTVHQLSEYSPIVVSSDATQKTGTHIDTGSDNGTEANSIFPRRSKRWQGRANGRDNVNTDEFRAVPGQSCWSASCSSNCSIRPDDQDHLCEGECWSVSRSSKTRTVLC